MIPAYTWNRPQTMTFPGGTQRTYTYDALMRIQSHNVVDPNLNPLLDYQYTYDSVGNILTKTTEHGNYTYSYDPVSRLLTADNPVLADEGYTYDAVGNRITDSSVSGSWSYNQNNELLGYTDIEYDYDENGNLTEIRIAGSVVWTYEYDAANRLVHVEDGTGSISADYYYDPFGRRLWKDVGGTRTYFFYSEEGLIAEYDASGVEIRSYGYRPDSTWTTDPLFQKVGSTYYWYQNDHLGTPQKLVATDGTVVWSAQYTAFGDAVIDVATVTNNLRFPGQYEDAETGLYYNRFRYYDPKLGRYLRTDPMRFGGEDINLYVYVKNNPESIIDPLGLLSRSDIMEGRTLYSCNCGWIDTVHMGDARGFLWNRIWTEGIAAFVNSGDHIVEPRLNQAGLVTYVTGIVELNPAVREKKRQELLQIAFDIFLEFETAFEQHQSRIVAGEFWKHSGFSVEDLPSDFLGFLEAIELTFPNSGYGITDWKKLCKPLEIDESLEIFDAALLFEDVAGDIRRPVLLPWKNMNHIPQLWILNFGLKTTTNLNSSFVRCSGVVPVKGKIQIYLKYLGNGL